MPRLVPDMTYTVVELLSDDMRGGSGDGLRRDGSER